MYTDLRMFRRSRDTPLPVAQIAILMATRLAEPSKGHAFIHADYSIIHRHAPSSVTANTSVIFPFINEFVESLNVTDNPDRIGWYSGSVESVFALVQFFTVYHWAKLSE